MKSNKSFLIQHPSWALSTEMQEICEPLFLKFGINYVDYARYYPDGRVVSLYSDREYVNYFVTQSSYTHKPPTVLNEGFHLWSTYIDTDFVNLVADNFQHAHGMTLVNQQLEFKEIFNLATTPQNHAIFNIYLNQQHIIRQFISYFRRKAERALSKLEEHPIILPPSKLIIKETLLSQQQSIQDMQKYLIDNSHLTIHVNQVVIQLTKREAQCLYLVNKGKTAKQIGKILGMSHRTAETYLIQLRHKTASGSCMELIGKIQKPEIDNLEQLLPEDI
jgi:DNA-binding CsgD family transcriptional regulator